MKRSRRGSGKGILDDHARIGSRLKGPLLTLPQMQETSYIDKIIPQIIQIAMFLDAYGYADGIKLCENLFEAIGPFSDQSHMPLVSHLTVSHDNVARILDTLDRAGCLKEVQMANTPLCLLPSWPLSFLGQVQMDRPRAIDRLTMCVDRVLDKSKTPACAALGMVMYWQGVCGKLHYVNGVEPPDLNAMISDPDSLAAQKARSHVRASVIAFWGLSEDQGGIGADWSNLFWQECFRISPCMVEEVDHDDDD